MGFLDSVSGFFGRIGSGVTSVVGGIGDRITGLFGGSSTSASRTGGSVVNSPPRDPNVRYREVILPSQPGEARRAIMVREPIPPPPRPVRPPPVMSPPTPLQPAPMNAMPPIQLQVAQPASSGCTIL